MSQPPLSYPGVYVQEVPSGAHTITGVSTSIAAFIGRIPRGEMFAPKRILSFADYQREFGGDTATCEMTDRVRQFFLNGGPEAYCVRVAKGAKQAALSLTDETTTNPVLVVTARDAGQAGEQIRIEVESNTPSPERTFNLTAYQEITKPSGQTTTDSWEKHTDLSIRPADSRFCEANTCACTNRRQPDSVVRTLASNACSPRNNTGRQTKEQSVRAAKP